MAEITLLASLHSPHQTRHRELIAEGLRTLGHKAIVIERGEPQTHLVSCWGWRRGKELFERGHRVLVQERGYLGDRFAWTSLAWNGLNGRAQWPERPDDGGRRFRAHFSLAPWRSAGAGYALVVGQVPGDASLQGRDLRKWYEQQCEAARAAGLQPMYRQHPLDLKRFGRSGPKGVPRADGPLAEALAGAAQVITFNSNTGVDALLAGVPITADNEGSMAWPLAGRMVGELHTPEREQWAHDLAWRQWTEAEIGSGTALKGLML